MDLQLSENGALPPTRPAKPDLMQPVRFHIPKTRAHSHLLQVDEGTHFYGHLHVHPEIQITAVERGSGQVTIADGLHPFEAGQVWVFGSNLPHMFRNDRPGIRAWSIFLEPPARRHSLLALPELSGLLQQLPLRHGLMVHPDAAPSAFRQIRCIHRTPTPVQRLRGLLGLLEWLACEGHLLIVHYAACEGEGGGRDKRLLDRVFAWCMRHYSRPIRLEEAAQLVHMHPTAFARLFKARTGRSFICWLNEVRIHAACRLLENPEWRISEAAFAVGFRNLSHFNKLFKRYIGLPPRQWRRRHFGSG